MLINIVPYIEGINLYNLFFFLAKLQFFLIEN